MPAFFRMERWRRHLKVGIGSRRPRIPQELGGDVSNTRTNGRWEGGMEDGECPFPETEWNLVLDAGQGEGADHGRALESLCLLY